MSDMEHHYQRREKKRQAERRRIKKHGKNISVVYRNAILKRAATIPDNQ